MYSFGNRENVRKCEQQVKNVFSMVFSRTQPNIKKYFPKHFLKCNKTHENVFFSRKQHFRKIDIFRKYFYTNQTQPQPHFSNQLFQVIPQSSTILYGVPSVLVVLAMKALIALHGITFHLTWSFKEWLVLGFLQDLVYWFSKHLVNNLSNG